MKSNVSRRSLAFASLAQSTEGFSSTRKTVGQSQDERWHPLTVFDFGARGDGTTDDTTSFQKAVDYASVTGATLVIPATERGYLITETIIVRCRKIVGENSWIDSANRGTLILFKPRRADDLLPCFALIEGMYSGGGIENLTIMGPVVYRRSQLRQWIDPTLLPRYDASAPGVCGIAVYNSNQPVFRNVFTRDLKVGLLLDSKNGHVSSYDCSWNGLFGVYCRRNSEDYLFLGGSIGGVYANVIFGTIEHAGHVGGMTMFAFRVHMGFAPYAFYQVVDAPYKKSPYGLQGRFDVVRFERIGEAVIQVLPDSTITSLCIDSFGFSWSKLHTGYPIEPNGWSTNLPPALLPYEHQQQFAMRLGRLSGVVKLGWLGDAWPLKRSTHQSERGAIALVQSITSSSSLDLRGLEGDVIVRQS